MGGGAMHIDLPVIGCETLSSSSTLPYLPASSSNLNFPVPANSNTGVGPSRQSSAAACCSSSRGGKEDKRCTGSTYSLVFDSVPSQFEVESAMAALQSLMQLISSSGSKFSLFRQLFNGCDLRTLFSHGCGGFLDAFHMLQMDPSVKKLVVSLSSDKAVWEAIMNNVVVCKLRDSHCSDGIGKPQHSNKEPDFLMQVLTWIMVNVKAKMVDFIDKFQALTSEIFHPTGTETNPEIRETFEEKVRSSLLVSIVIILIVVVDRIQRA